VLLLLDERPMHGYELITEMTERSAGRWEPSPGTIYPALNRMA
jgi:DNA-binding PadR family transcriptional regulator